MFHRKSPQIVAGSGHLIGGNDSVAIAIQLDAAEEIGARKRDLSLDFSIGMRVEIRNAEAWRVCACSAGQEHDRDRDDAHAQDPGLVHGQCVYRAADAVEVEP